MSAKRFRSVITAGVLFIGHAYAAQTVPLYSQSAKFLPMAEAGAPQLEASAIAPDEKQIALPTNGTTTILALRALAPMSDGELSASRGGFLMADGIEFDFAANVQTLVNGQLALQTTVQYAPSGAAVQQTLGLGANVTPISPSQLAALFGAGIGNAASGVQISEPTGSIEVGANVSGNQVQNLVVNSASNQSISQNTAVALTIYNFPTWQQQLAVHAIANQLANEALISRIGQ